MTLKKMIEQYEQQSLCILSTIAEPTCPNCGDTLEEDDHYDTTTSSNWTEHHIVGHCPTCDKEYQWNTVFLLAGVSDLREEK